MAPHTFLLQAARRVRRRLYPIPALARQYIGWSTLQIADRLPRRAVCLDLGAGTSPYHTEICSNLDTPFYISFDLAPSEATTLIGDACQIPLRDASVQLMISMDTLQHIPNIDLAFCEMARVLEGGGYLIASFPFTYGECDVIDFRRWSLSGMRQDLAKHGFAIEDIRPRGGAFFALASMLHWSVQHAIPGSRRSWRSGISALALARLVLVGILTLPTALLGWLALGLDGLLPRSGLYMGGLVLARRISNCQK